MSGLAADPVAAPTPSRRYLVRQWLGFVAGSGCVLVAGYVALLVAFFGGGHDGTGQMIYAAGAVGSTGTLLLLTRRFTVRVIRITVVGLAVTVGLCWLLELPAFLRSPGWQF